MENIIKYVVECDSAYGVAALAIIAVCLVIIAILAYNAIRFVLLFVYKIICKVCNTFAKYKDVHTKAGVKDISIETELHR